MAAAPGGGGGAAGGRGGSSSSMTKAELVRRWEDVFDDVGDDDRATELFMTLLLRDARADYAAQQQQGRNDEEEQRRARVFQPWHPPSSALKPPMTPVRAAAAPCPRVERAVVLGLRAPPHLMPPGNVDGRTTTSAPAKAAADFGGVPPGWRGV